MKRSLAIVGLLCALLSSGPVAAQCLEYEPSVVSLSGILVRETHPGRPNYRSIAKGDEPETIWVLRLREVVCVLASNEFDVKEDGQKEVQLALEPSQYKQYRKLLGKKVTATGQLFHSHTVTTINGCCSRQAKSRKRLDDNLDAGFDQRFVAMTFESKFDQLMQHLRKLQT
jgi:Domain of unknown function (DUF4431)